MKKILIIGPAWIGDMVMAQSLFKLIKAEENPCEIDVIAPSWTIPLLKRMPEISGYIELPINHGEFAFSKRKKIAKELQAKNYDQAILTTRSWKSALIPFLAKIPKRTGWLGEWRYGLINDIRSLDIKKYPLMIERFALLSPLKNNFVQPLPWPKLDIDQENQKFLKAHWKISNKPILALCPGAEYGPAKRWPPAYFAELARYYAEKDWQVILFGSPKDEPIAHEICQFANTALLNLCGKISLADAIDILGLAEMVVSNDSGLMHIAASLERPIVVVYGSTASTFTPPLSHKAEIVKLDLECSPCFKRECPLKHTKCLNDLLPGQVIVATEKLLI